MAKKRAKNTPSGLSPSSAELLVQLSPDFGNTAGRRELLTQALLARDLAQAARAARHGELTIVTGRSGLCHTHPLVKVELDAQKSFLKFAGALGLRITADQILLAQLCEPERKEQ